MKIHLGIQNPSLNKMKRNFLAFLRSNSNAPLPNNNNKF